MSYFERLRRYALRLRELQRIGRGELPDTPLQHWLGGVGACLEWRERVWARTAREVWAERDPDLIDALAGLFMLDGPVGGLSFEQVAEAVGLPPELW